MGGMINVFPSTYLINKLDMSKLEVTITYATLTKNYDTFGKMENYVRLRVSSGNSATSEFKTKIVSGDKEKPITWNETVSIPIQSKTNTVFEFAVLD